MNKRILYALILTSIFIVSTVSLIAQPAAAYHWKLGIPEQAKGMSVESEVKIYDKSAWGDHLGNKYGDSVNAIYGGDGSDANDVGARSKTKVNDWDHTDVDFFGEHVMELDVGKDENGQPLVLLDKQLDVYWDAVRLINEILHDLSLTEEEVATFDETGIVYQLAYALSLTYQLSGAIPPNFYVWDLGSVLNTAHSDSPFYVNRSAAGMQWRTSVGLLTVDESIATFGKKYKGTEIEIDAWDFVKEGDFDSEPDEDDWVRPIIDDPHDYYEIYKQFNAYLGRQMIMIDTIIASIEDVAGRLEGCKNRTMEADGFGLVAGDAQENFWNFINSSSIEVVRRLLPPGSAPNYDDKVAIFETIFNKSGPYVENIPALIFDALINATGNNPIQILADYPGGLGLAEPYVVDLVPLQKKEFLATLFEEGIYAMQPVDKYLEKLIDDFDIDGDAIWGDDWTINGITAYDELHKGGIEVEGTVVTVKYEWVNLVYDTVDGIIQVKREHEAMIPDMVKNGTLPESILSEKPRKDYKIIYTYGDTGGQISIEYKGSDTFYKIESIAPLIPGYEVTILLASAAISALALIYVVMKKKRM